MTRYLFHFHQHGNTCSFDLGYIPTTILIRGIKSGSIEYDFWSTNSLSNMYGAYNSTDGQVTSSSAFSIDGTTITMTSSSGDRWRGYTLYIYAIR